VERRSIPHFRIMGRNIRFVRSDRNYFVVPSNRTLNRNEFCRRAALIAGGQKLPSPIVLSKQWVTGGSAYAQKLSLPDDCADLAIGVCAQGRRVALSAAKLTWNSAVRATPESNCR
jgi:hypothetical protein